MVSRRLMSMHSLKARFGPNERTHKSYKRYIPFESYGAGWATMLQTVRMINLTSVTNVVVVIGFAIDTKYLLFDESMIQSSKPK